MALIVDEYGGVQGIVTQTDILEAIAGDLPDIEDEEPEVAEQKDGSFLINGTMSIYDAEARLDLGMLPDGDFNTLAGFVLSLFERIPAVGERVVWRDWSFEVSEMDGRRINRVLARRVAADKKSSAANG